MDERTRRSAGYCDLLVWVLTSRQLLSQVEMTFLTEHVRHSGPALRGVCPQRLSAPGHVEEWEQFLTRSAPQLLDKVRHFAPDMGFPAGSLRRKSFRWRAARCASTGRTPSAGRICCACCSGWTRDFMPGSCALACGAPAQNCRAAFEPLEVLLASEEGRSEPATQRMGRREPPGRAQAAIGRGAGANVELFLEEFSADARARATELAARLTDIVAASGGVYARQLNQGIADAAEPLLTQLNTRVAATVKRFGEAPLSEEWTNTSTALRGRPKPPFSFRSDWRPEASTPSWWQRPHSLRRSSAGRHAWLASVRTADRRVTDGVIAAMQARRALFCEAFDSCTRCVSQSRLHRMSLRSLCCENCGTAWAGVLQRPPDSRPAPSLTCRARPTGLCAAGNKDSPDEHVRHRSSTRRHLSSLCARAARRRTLALVGDGARSMIPNTVVARGQWGSSALGPCGSVLTQPVRGAHG